MKGFISKNATLQECFDFLKADGAERHPMYDEIRMQYDSELKKWQDADNQLFALCYTVTGCKKYLAQFCDVYYYSPLHQQEVTDRYEDLFWAEKKTNGMGRAEYLKQFPQGKYAKEVAKKNKNDNLALGCMVTGAVVLLMSLIFFLAVFV